MQKFPVVRASMRWSNFEKDVWSALLEGIEIMSTAAAVA